MTVRTRPRAASSTTPRRGGRGRVDEAGSTARGREGDGAEAERVADAAPVPGGAQVREHRTPDLVTTRKRTKRSPAPRGPRPTPFGSVWDSQLGTTARPRRESRPVADDEDFDEPEFRST